MPYELRTANGKHCVAKKSGEVLKCYSSRDQATAYLRALYANVTAAASQPDFQGRFREGEIQAASHLDQLTRKYESAFRAQAKKSQAAYEEYHLPAISMRRQLGLTADGVNPEIPPNLINEQAFKDSVKARTLPTRKKMINEVAVGLLGKKLYEEKQNQELFAVLIEHVAAVQSENAFLAASDAVHSAILEGLTEGYSVAQTADVIGETMTEWAGWQARRQAQTDLISLANGASLTSAQILGDDGPQFKTWISAGDDKVRPAHRDLNRKTVPIDGTWTYGGSSLRYPGDPLGPDGLIINCRCSLVYTDTPPVALEHSANGGIQEDGETVLALAASLQEESCFESDGATSASILDIELEDSGALAASHYDPVLHPRWAAGRREGGRWSPRRLQVPAARSLEEVEESAAEKGVILNATENEGEIVLSRIESTQKGEGKASEALDELGEYADEQGRPIFLSPEAVGEGLTTEELRAWYARHGYVPVGKAMVREIVASVVDFSDGTMIALYPQPHEAEALARESGQPAADLHVTLAFLPNGVNIDPEELTSFLSALAGITGVLVGEVGGLGVFKAGDKGRPLIALPDVPGMNELRADLVGLLDLIGQEYAGNHGFIPHITIEYLNGTGPLLEDEGQEGVPLTFTALSLVRGRERTDFLFAEPSGNLTAMACPPSERELRPKDPGGVASVSALALEYEQKHLSALRDKAIREPVALPNEWRPGT